MKTILVPIESHEAIRPTLETALMLARRFDSYVEGFALRFRVNEFVAVDMAGAIPLESLRDENLEEARRARQPSDGFPSVSTAARIRPPRMLRFLRKCSWSAARSDGSSFVQKAWPA